MLTFKPSKKDENSIAAAIISGGPYKGKTVYVVDDKEAPDRSLDDEDAFDVLSDDDFNQHTYKKLKLQDRMKLVKALKQGVEPLDEYLVSKYNTLSEKVNNKLKKELELSSGVMIPLPSDKSERIFIAGKAGSGKSCLAAKYAEMYQTLFPKNNVYLFTKHENEEAYKDIDHIEVLCDDLKNLDLECSDEDSEDPQGPSPNPLEITRFRDSLVIFDDCDHIQDKEISKKLCLFNNDLITAGRKYNIYVVTLMHQLMDYKSTRNLLNESNKVFFFNSSSSYHVTRYLKTYAGLSPETIKKIMKVKSRWCMLYLGTPGYLLHEHGIFII